MYALQVNEFVTLADSMEFKYVVAVLFCEPYKDMRSPHFESNGEFFCSICVLIIYCALLSCAIYARSALCCARPLCYCIRTLNSAASCNHEAARDSECKDSHDLHQRRAL